jgi:hypothetical protein
MFVAGIADDDIDAEDDRDADVSLRGLRRDAMLQRLVDAVCDDARRAELVCRARACVRA